MSNDERALVVFVDAQDPAGLARLKALVDARTTGAPAEPPAGPSTYRGVPVPSYMRPHWSMPQSMWWRAGVDAALDVTRPLVESLHYDDPCRLDHNGGCQEHSYFGEGRCPDAEAAEFIAASKEGATTDE